MKYGWRLKISVVGRGTRTWSLPRWALSHPAGCCWPRLELRCLSRPASVRGGDAIRVGRRRRAGRRDPSLDKDQTEDDPDDDAHRYEQRPMTQPKAEQPSDPAIEHDSGHQPSQRSATRHRQSTDLARTGRLRSPSRFRTYQSPPCWLHPGTRNDSPWCRRIRPIAAVRARPVRSQACRIRRTTAPRTRGPDHRPLLTRAAAGNHVERLVARESHHGGP